VKSAHRIRVLGREIQVRSSAPAEAVQEVESFVNQRLAEVAVSMPNADQQLVTLLTLLNITESYLVLKRQNGVDDCASPGSVDRILQKIDKALA